MKSLREELLLELASRKWEGIHQNEIYHILPYSRSHVSETISRLITEGVLIRESGKQSNRKIWLKDFYPFQIHGIVRVGILRSSEYVPFLSSLKKTATDFNYELRVKVFDSAPELISHLHNSVLDIALAPTFTHILFSLTTGRESIICSVAGGGSSVVENTLTSSMELATSQSSTMNLLSRSLVKREGLNVTFFNEPGFALEKFVEGEFKYLAIWEPYLSSITKREGFTDLHADPDTSLLDPCCSAGANVEFLLQNKEFVEHAVSDYSLYASKLDREELSYGLDVVSEATGFSPDEIFRSLQSYEFHASSDYIMFEKYMYEVGIPLSTNLLKKMIYRR